MSKSTQQCPDEFPVALFDVDGTLIKGSSSFEGTWFLFKRGRVGPHHIAMALWYALLHGMGLVTYERMYRIGLRLFHGMAVEEAITLSRRCLEERVAARFFVGAIDELRAQRATGRTIVLVSAGPRYLVQVIGARLEADAVITAGPLIRGCRLTDVLDGPLCSGPGKVQRVRQYLWERGMALANCVYYGDSINDLPLLELVGQPIAVNPDPRLMKVALAKGWKIVQWRKTAGKQGHSSRGASVSS